MPIADYLKTAAAQLRQAADAAKREADEIRADIIRREQDLKRNISNLENVIQERRRELAIRPPEDNNPNNLSIITGMEQEVKNMQQNFEKEKQQLLNEIQNREQQLNSLNVKASELERAQI